MTDELMPCAHCNHDAKFVREIQMSPVSPVLGYILCPNCGMRTGCMLLYSEAIAAWNTRHTPCDLSSIDNISLMAESVRRGLATVESDRLPQWAITMINHMIDACNIKNEDYALGYLAALDDVLYLRKPEDKE